MLENLSKNLQKLVHRTQGNILHKIFKGHDELTSDEQIIKKYAQKAFEGKGKDFFKELETAQECPITLLPILEPVRLIHADGTMSQYLYEKEAIENWKEIQERKNGKGNWTNPFNRQPGKNLVPDNDYIKSKTADGLFECFMEYYNQTLLQDEKKEIDQAINNIIPVVINKELLNNILLALTKERNLEGVKEAVKLGANINTTSNFNGFNHGDTPLFIAAQLGYKEIVEELLKHKPNVNAKNNYGRTALLAAAYKGNTDVVKLLLAANGIDVNFGKGSEGHGENTPIPEDSETLPFPSRNLEAAEQFFATEKFKVTFVKDNKSTTSNYGETPLFVASREGHVKAVQQLLKVKEIKVNLANEDGETPLYVACKYGHLEIVKQLLKVNEIDIKLANKNGETPLSIANKNGHSDVVEALSAPKADINTKESPEEKKKMLFNAAGKGDLDELEELLLNLEEAELKEIVSVTNKDDDEWTLLHYAAYKGNTKVVELLLKHGADPKAESEFKETPLSLADQERHVKVVELLTTPNKEVRGIEVQLTPNKEVGGIEVQPAGAAKLKK